MPHIWVLGVDFATGESHLPRMGGHVHSTARQQNHGFIAHDQAQQHRRARHGPIQVSTLLNKFRLPNWGGHEACPQSQFLHAFMGHRRQMGIDRQDRGLLGIKARQF